MGKGRSRDAGDVYQRRRPKQGPRTPRYGKLRRSKRKMAVKSLEHRVEGVLRENGAMGVQDLLVVVESSKSRMRRVFMFIIEGGYN